MHDCHATEAGLKSLCSTVKLSTQCHADVRQFLSTEAVSNRCAKLSGVEAHVLLMVVTTPPIVTDGILHAPLQVCACKMVLADIQVGHGGVLQLLGEGLPGLKADLKVLPSVQGPDAALLQNFSQS